jgi:hypothetical protein
MARVRAGELGDALREASMRTLSKWTVVATAMTMWISGCGGASAPRASDHLALRARPIAMQPIAQPAISSEDGVDPRTLPPSPWSDIPLTTGQVPAPVLVAWERAENRNTCAPIMPRELGAGAGARARVSDFTGGWAVEFDRRGAPGIARNGQNCTHCGRGVFGIAGTNLSPEDLVDEDSASDVPEPTFADGSHLQIEPPAEGEQVAAATLTVRGQGCVYQVWSFLGEEHVRQLVAELRMVDVGPNLTHVAAR